MLEAKICGRADILEGKDMYGRGFGVGRGNEGKRGKV